VRPPQPPSVTKPGDRTLDDSSVSTASNRSPFQRVKKHVKQIITRECVAVREETIVFWCLLLDNSSIMFRSTLCGLTC